jgi:DNA mismatch repair protein MutL
MSDVIKLLPDSVANQIAAGEVIQRPASVIKELVENAIDAHATRIDIVLKDAGRTLIQVIDNGDGMSETDARLAFERHSTSKISQASDLFSLHTMGFRGEALASISAIAHVELRTRRRGAELGTRLFINASTCESQEPDMCPEGSNFMIKDIFFNVPARRKFLKSNQVELSNIVKEFEKLALINPQVEFSLTHNGNAMFKLMSGNFKQRIAALFGRNIDQQIVPVNISTSLVGIHGFVGKPENVRKRGALQYLFVNGRYMRHPYFHKAILSCYDQIIPADTQPNYFVIFDVEPESIDVNIHPTKTEIKFENEMPIWQILAAAVKESIGRFSAVPQIDFNQEGAINIPNLTSHTQVTPPASGADPTYNPFQVKSSHHTTRPENSIITDWEKLYANFTSGKSMPAESAPPVDLPVDATLDATDDKLIDSDLGVSKCIQLRTRYLLSPIKSGLMVIDQHRAHIKVLYEQYIHQIKEQKVKSQTVLFPDIMHLTPAQNIILKELEPEMESVGFSLSQLGGNDWSISALPAGLGTFDVKDTLLQVIESVTAGGESVSDTIHGKIALTVARNSAIPYGKVLTQDEMEDLLAKLLQLSNPNYTPDGKTIISVISNEQIEKLF